MKLNPKTNKADAFFFLEQFEWEYQRSKFSCMQHDTIRTGYVTSLHRKIV